MLMSGWVLPGVFICAGEVNILDEHADILYAVKQEETIECGAAGHGVGSNNVASGKRHKRFREGKNTWNLN